MFRGRALAGKTLLLGLALLTQVVRRLPVGDGAHRLLADFDPHGTASDFSVRWDGVSNPVAGAAAASAAVEQELGSHGVTVVDPGEVVFS